jgi:hypothetical protein
MTGTINASFTVTELATSAGVFAFDTQASKQNTAQFYPGGVSLTLNGTNPDVVFQAAAIPGGASGMTDYPTPLNGFNWVNLNDSFGILLNVTTATAPIPFYDDLQNNATIVTGVAFKTM